VPLLSSLSKEQYAIKVRQHLALAKVDRARLTENTPTTMHVGFRSWRDTGITWLALSGVDVVKMQRRAGHDNVSTTMGYVKSAEDIAGTIGTPFPELPESLVKPSKESGGRGGGGVKRDRAKSPESGQVGRLHRVLPAKVVAPPGVEPELSAATSPEGTSPIVHPTSGPNRTGSEPFATSSQPTAAAGQDATEPSDVDVEAALARAIDRASAAGRFDVVALLAGELHGAAARGIGWHLTGGSGTRTRPSARPLSGSDGGP
jgi:hypothetical protein